MLMSRISIEESVLGTLLSSEVLNAEEFTIFGKKAKKLNQELFLKKEHRILFRAIKKNLDVYGGLVSPDLMIKFLKENLKGKIRDEVLETFIVCLQKVPLIEKIFDISVKSLEEENIKMRLERIGV